MSALRVAGLACLIVASASLVPQGAAAAPVFPVVVVDPAGNSPQSVRVADLNSDGRFDVVTANAGSNTISVLLGHGDGTFASPTTYATGLGPADVVLADINADGRLDAITANFGDSTASILLGNGLGVFGVKTDVAVGPQPYRLRVVDVNGDGRKDILTANIGSVTFSVLLRMSNGAYATHVDYGVTLTPTDLAIGDVNGDGHQDVVASGDNADNAGLALGNGNGSFQAPVQISTGGPQRGVALADLNGDGKLDLVTANNAPSQMVVQLGNGNGTFQPRVGYPAGGNPQSLLIQDVTGDSKLDIVGAASGDNTITLLPGNGNGTFATHKEFPTGSQPVMVQAADINADGRPDFVVADYQSSFVDIVFGLPGQNPGVKIFPSDNIEKMKLANIDGVAPLDVVTFDQQCFNTCVYRRISVHRGNGDGTLSAGSVNTIENSEGSPSTRAFGFAVEDFNSDGKPDALTCMGGSDLVLLPGRGDGTFGTQLHSAADVGLVGVPGLDALVPGDFNNDGILDVIAGAHAWLGAGNGTFYAGPANTGGWQLAARLDGDNNLDLVQSTRDSAQVAVALGNGDGSFQTPVRYGAGAHPNGVAVRDVNHDRKLDLAVANTDENTVSIRLGNGTGEFGSRVDFPTASAPYRIEIVDVDNDGNQDLVTLGSMITVLLGHGDGTFGERVDYGPEGMEGQFMQLQLGDMDGDHRQDVVVGRAAISPVAVELMRNIGTHAINDVGDPVVDGFAFVVAPNPTRSGSRVTYSAATDGPARVEILDLSGRRIANLFTGWVPAGLHSVSWTGTAGSGHQARPGVYLVRLSLGSESHSRKLVWLGQ